MVVKGVKRWRILSSLLLCHLGHGEGVVELSPLMVEAWHFDQLGGTVPADVVRLESAEIQASGLATIPQVLEQLAGVRFRGFTGNGTEGQLAMRGFGDNSGLRVLVLLDGLEYNPVDMGGINWLGLDVGELETVEVIRGGQTVLYGNHAVSGVIKLRTRSPGSDPELKAGLESGSDDYFRGSISAGAKAGLLGIRTGFHLLESDGYRDNASMKSRSGYLAWQSGDEDRTHWNGRFQFDRTEMQFPGPLGYDQLRQNPRQSVNSGNEGSETETWTASLSGQGESSFGKWEVQSGYLLRDRESNLDDTIGDNKQSRFSVDPRIRMEAGEGYVIFGTDVALDWLETIDYLDPEKEAVRARADIERTTIGGYIFTVHHIGKDWQVSTGLRIEEARTDNLYEHYKEEQLLPILETNRGSIPNPNYKNPPDVDPELSFDGVVQKSGWAAEFSLLRTWESGLSVWAGWDRIYRYPTVDESGSYQGYPLAIPLNANLEPETGDNFEIGIKQSSSHWHLGTTVFLMELNDEIVFDEEVPLNVNVGDSRRKGIEVDGEWRRDNAGLSARAAWIDAAFTESEMETGKKMPLVPEYELGVNGWIRPHSDWRLRVHWQYQSEQVQGNDFANLEERRIPAYSLTGISLFWEPTSRTTAYLVVDNLFNKTYAVTAYSGGFYPGAARQFRLGVRHAF